MARSVIRSSFPAALRSRRGWFAAPAVIGALAALALAALAAPSAVAQVPATAKPKVITTIKLSLIPSAVAIGPRTGTVYIASYLDRQPPEGTITVVNGKTRKVITTIVDDHRPTGAAVSPLTSDVYIANQGDTYPPNGIQSGGLWVISGKTNKVIATVADVTSASAVTVSPKTGDVYALASGPKASGVLVISAKTNKIITAVPDPDDAAAVAVSPLTGNVYVLNSGVSGSSVWVVSGKTNKVIAKIAVASDAAAVAVSPLTGNIYVTSATWVRPDGNPQLGRIQVINAKTNKVIITVQDGNSPWGVAFSPRSGDPYIANQGWGENATSYPGNVSLLNPKTNKVIGSITDLDFPTGLAVSPQSGDAYVDNSNETVWVVSP